MKQKILIIVFGAIFVVSTFGVLSEKRQLQRDMSLNEELQEVVLQEVSENKEITLTVPSVDEVLGDEPVSTQEEPIPQSDEPVVLDKLVELYERNHDMVGYISNGDFLSYPIMQSIGESDFYLNRDFDRNESVSGSLFIQSNVTLDIESGICMVHGHNMKNDTMFGNLDKYMDKQYLAENPTIQIDTLFEEQTYEVLGVFLQQVYPDDYEGFKFYDYVGDVSEDEFNEYKTGISKLMQSGDVSDMQYGDKIIELSTCYYHVKNGRLVVVCRRQGS